MKKRWVSIALCAAVITGSLTGRGLRSLGATTAALAATEVPTEIAKAKGDVAEESKTEAVDAGATADTSDIPEVILIMVEVSSLGAIVGQADTRFKETVEGLSGSKIKIDLQASGVLGSENDVLDTMPDGGSTVDTSRISAFTLTSYGAEKSALLSISYTSANCDRLWKFADSELAPEFFMEPRDNGPGIRDPYHGEEGFRRLFTVKEVKGLDNLKGMKLHMSNNPVMNGIVEGLGVNLTVVSPNELYSALQTGVVDGAEQPIANYRSNAFQGVAPNLILDGCTLGAIQVTITGEAWDKLTEEQQNILTEVGKVVFQFGRIISEEAENKVPEKLEADGINVVEVSDIKPWQDVCKGITESPTRDQAELY